MKYILDQPIEEINEKYNENNNIKKVIKKLTINKEYFIHPIYDLYAASNDDEIIHIVKQKLVIWYETSGNIHKMDEKNT